MSKLLFLLTLLLVWGSLPSYSEDRNLSTVVTNLDKSFKNIQLMADQVRKEVESSLNRTFGTWDLLDFSLPFDKEKDYYWMKIRTDDGGHVKVKTLEKEPGKPERVHVEEYDKGTKALKQEVTDNITTEGEEKGDQISEIKSDTKEVSEIGNFERYFDTIQEVADRIRHDVESKLDRAFSKWNLMDYSLPIDPEKSYLRMKVKTDDNGHVRVKFAEKEPGKPWEVKIEELDRGDKGKAIEGRTEAEVGALGQGGEGESNQQSMPVFDLISDQVSKLKESSAQNIKILYNIVLGVVCIYIFIF